MNMLSIDLQDLLRIVQLKEKEFLDDQESFDYFGEDNTVQGLIFQITASIIQVSRNCTATQELDIGCYLELPCPRNLFYYQLELDLPSEAQYLDLDGTGEGTFDNRLHKLQLLSPKMKDVSISATILNNVDRECDTEIEDWEDCTAIDIVSQSDNPITVDVNSINVKKAKQSHNILFSIGVAFDEDSLKMSIDKEQHHDNFYAKYCIQRE